MAGEGPTDGNRVSRSLFIRPGWSSLSWGGCPYRFRIKKRSSGGGALAAGLFALLALEELRWVGWIASAWQKRLASDGSDGLGAARASKPSRPRREVLRLGVLQEMA